MTALPKRRVDWATLVGTAATLAMSVPCIYTQLRGEVYRDAEDVYFGWPIVHPNNTYRLVSNAFLIDATCALVISAATGIVIAAIARRVMERRQFTLHSAFAFTAFLATMCALFRYFRDYNVIVAADFIDDGVLVDVIALRYKAWVMTAIIFGEACIPFAAWILVMRRRPLLSSRPAGA
jgi:uncharacterized membrane protein YozB (DUF420 family)